jgi:hypothetical protein
MSHNLDVSGDATWVVVCPPARLPHTRSLPTPRAPLAAPIRRLEAPIQMHVLKNCVYRRNYRQKLTACLLGYPRGYSVSNA